MTCDRHAQDGGGVLDLILAEGRVIDPAQEVDDSLEVGIRGERIVAVAKNLPRSPRTRVVSCRDWIVVPGLIDLHVHVARGLDVWSICADDILRQSGATTLLDAGSTGSDTWPRMREEILPGTQARVLTLINLSRVGLLPENAGELLDPALADPQGVVAAIRRDPATVRGVKLRAGAHLMGEGEQGWRHLRQAVEAAREAGSFLMVHIGNTPMPLPNLVAQLAPGDVITHCYKGGPYHHRVLDEKGRVYPSLLEAAQAGVVFDVGHGVGSFDWEVAERAMDQGLLPTTLSTDLHVKSVREAVFDLPTTMTKFLRLGLSLSDVVARCTMAPACVLGLQDQIGSLRPGSTADVTLLRWHEHPATLLDSYGQARHYHGILRAVGVIRAGRIVRLEEEGPTDDDAFGAVEEEVG